jgi:hypothetical protein
VFTSRRLLVILGTAATVAVMSSVSAQAATLQFVALWHMNETSGTAMVDSSGNNNDGTIVDVTLGMPGHSGTAYGFNGTSSYVTVPDAPSLNPGTSKFPFGAWVNLSTPPAVGTDYDILRKGYSGTPGAPSRTPQGCRPSSCRADRTSLTVPGTRWCA